MSKETLAQALRRHPHWGEAFLEAHEIASLLWRYYLLPLPDDERARVTDYFAAVAPAAAEKERE